MTTTRIINNGAHQTIELPEGYRIEGEEAFVKKVGNAVVLLSRDNPWEPLMRSLSMFSDDFMTTRLQPQLDKEREGLE